MIPETNQIIIDRHLKDLELQAQAFMTRNNETRQPLHRNPLLGMAVVVCLVFFVAFVIPAV